MYQKISCGDIADLEFDLDLLDPSMTSLMDFNPLMEENVVSTRLMNVDGAYDEEDSDSDSDVTTSDESNQEWTTSARAPASASSSSKRAKLTANGMPRQLPGPKSSRRIEDMTPQEINRRQRRRERNKAAAARCRQRRLDITTQLTAETQQLEEEGRRLEREIENLRKQRDQLEFVLEAHKPMCLDAGIMGIKSDPRAMMLINVMPVAAAAATTTSAVRPSSLSIASSSSSSNMHASTLSSSSAAQQLNFGPSSYFDLGSTGVTPIVSSSGMNLFMGTGSAFVISPTTLLGSPTTTFAL